MPDPIVTNTNPYPELVLSLGNQYPSITVTTPNPILVGGGGIAGQRGATGNTGATGFGYTGAFISGATLYMSPVINGVEQSPIIIGTVSSVGGAETLWTNNTPITVSVGGLNLNENLVGKNAISILEEMLYPYQPVGFYTFSVQLNSGITNAELGQSIGASTINAIWSITGPGPNTNWVENTVAVLRNVNGSNPTTLASGLNYSDLSSAINHPSYVYNTPTTLGFEIKGQQDEGEQATLTENYFWKYKMYWGAYENADLTLLANLNSFSSAFIISTPNTARSFSTGGTEKYFYFLVPQSFTSYSSFKSIIGANESIMAFEPEGTISFQNPYLQNINYKYYRSTNPSSIANITILPST
jgi:hypothetical protein